MTMMRYYPIQFSMRLFLWMLLAMAVVTVSAFTASVTVTVTKTRMCQSALTPPLETFLHRKNFVDTTRKVLPTTATRPFLDNKEINKRYTLLLASKNPEDPPIDGSERGRYLLAIALLVCLWGFTIPPELRRAHWCFSERCTNNRTFVLCHNCVTFGEWKDDVLAYYANGGGIKWDFTVGEEVKELYSGKKSN